MAHTLLACKPAMEGGWVLILKQGDDGISPHWWELYFVVFIVLVDWLIHNQSPKGRMWLS